LIHSNSVLYNGPDSELSRSAEKLYESAEAAIQSQSEILARLEAQLPDKENFEKVKLNTG
jgi:Tfp pilus assembly protein PilN